MLSQPTLREVNPLHVHAVLARSQPTREKSTHQSQNAMNQFIVMNRVFLVFFLYNASPSLRQDSFIVPSLLPPTSAPEAAQGPSKHTDGWSHPHRTRASPRYKTVAEALGEVTPRFLDGCRDFPRFFPTEFLLFFHTPLHPTDEFEPFYIIESSLKWLSLPSPKQLATGILLPG